MALYFVGRITSLPLLQACSKVLWRFNDDGPETERRDRAGDPQASHGQRGDPTQSELTAPARQHCQGDRDTPGRAQSFCQGSHDGNDQGVPEVTTPGGQGCPAQMDLKG